MYNVCMYNVTCTCTCTCTTIKSQYYDEVLTRDEIVERVEKEGMEKKNKKEIE